jgi:hypothetical protein
MTSVCVWVIFPWLICHCFVWRHIVLFSPLQIFLPTRQPKSQWSKTNYMYQELASKSPNISHQIEKSGKRKKKTHLWTWSSTWTRGYRSRRPSGRACTAGSQALATPYKPLVLDPSFTDVCCYCLGDDLKDIYRQNLERIVRLLGES